MATSKEPIRQLLSRPDLIEKSKNLQNDYLTCAQHQYQILLQYLRKLKQDHPDKAKMLERREKSTRTKKADPSTAFTKDKEISALYNVLKMTESKEEEWDEFYYLLNARYFLNEAYGNDAKTFSTSCDRQTKGAVLGSGNNPTHQNIGGRPASQSYTQGMANASGMSMNISDPQNTHHGLSGERGRGKADRATNTGKSEIQQTNKTGTSEKQQTDLQKDNRHLPTHQSAHTEKMTTHPTHASAAASNFPKKDVPCASVINVDKISKSEYANLKPIQKALHKLKLTCTDLTAAEHQYYQLFKRDENFKRRFPEQHRELQVLMRDPEECAITSHKALYSALRRLQKTDPLYREAWEEFFFLITSEQEFIIAERCDKVIPRKSYEDLQNELVEKNKQIDELTSRLRDNKTERADLNSKPLMDYLPTN